VTTSSRCSPRSESFPNFRPADPSLSTSYPTSTPYVHIFSTVPAGGFHNCVQAKLLHGEQYLAIKAPIPTNAELVNEARLLEVLDKGKAAAVTSIVETKDKKTGKVIFENQSTVFIRGSGGFGGKREGKGK
jgi:hypothetical protein